MVCGSNMNAKIKRNKKFQYTVNFTKLELNQLTILRWALGQTFPLDKDANKEAKELSSALEAATNEFFTTGPGSK